MKILLALALAFFSLESFAQVVPTIPSGTILGNSSGSTAAPSALTQSQINSVLEITRANNLPHWRNALAKVRAGTGRGRILFIGDSTTGGTGSGSGGGLTGAWGTSFPNDVANILAARGIPTSSKSIAGDQGVKSGAAVDYGTYDTRVTLGTGWATNTLSIAGGGAFNSTGTGTLAFTPVGNIDTFETYHVKNAQGGASVTVNIDGGATLLTLTGGGAASISKTTQSVAKASHTINVVGVAGSVYLMGLVAYDSTVPAVDIIQAGAYGATVTYWAATTNPWDASSLVGVIGLYAPDLTVIDLTINDANTATATYLAKMAIIVATVQAAGSDVLIVTGNPTSSTSAQLLSNLSALSAYADTNNFVYLDIFSRWGSYASVNSLGWIFSSPHPNAVGYQDIAQAIATLLSGI